MGSPYEGAARVRREEIPASYANVGKKNAARVVTEHIVEVRGRVDTIRLFPTIAKQKRPKKHHNPNRHWFA